MDTAKARDLAKSILYLFEKSYNGDFAASIYPDDAGKPTIGWGHVVTRNESFSTPISREKAEQILEDDLAIFERVILASVKVPMTDAMMGALLSFAFNVGATAFRNSTLLRRLNEGDYSGAANEFMRWIYFTHPRTKEKIAAGGLGRRRKEEKYLFLSQGIPETEKPRNES